MIYERLWKLRKEHHMTQNNLAKVLNLSQRTYSRYENGERGIPNDVLIAMANYYDVSIDYLLGRTNDRRLSRG